MSTILDKEIIYLQPIGKAIDNASKMIAEKHLLPFSGPVLHHEVDSNTENWSCENQEISTPQVEVILRT